ncbi:hypothetical protein [Synechococcus sp. M16.1]|uniref:hypothetical protein n=1 Tax=Synechococcus sp. M16.1 TaxID=1442553 RepID=UPI0016486315
MNDILVVASGGGHFSVALNMMKKSRYYCRYIVCVDSPDFIDIKNSWNLDIPFFAIREIGRNPFRVLSSLFYAYILIRRFNIKLVFSTGATIAIPFLIVSRLMNIPSVFIDTPTRVYSLGLSGRLASFLATRFYVRHSSVCDSKYNVFPTRSIA